MNSKDKAKLVQLYEERYDKFGYDFKTVGWGNADSQLLRFRILSDIADLSGASVCDLGCGFGDLLHYLSERFSNVSYTGIDISPKIILEAKKRFSNGRFEIRDILTDPSEDLFDYVLSSGALTFKGENHEAFVEEMMIAMMKMAKKGVAVNFLSSYVDYEMEKNFHFAPEKAFSMGRKLTRYVSIRHDYPLYEFTLYLYKEPR